MKKCFLLLFSSFILSIISIHSQNIDLQIDRLEPVNVFMSFQKLDGDDVIRVIKDSAIKEFDEATFVKIKDLDFTNGTIEVKVLSRLLADAPDFSRGFIGLVFRVNEDNSEFESIYLRPTNARANDQVRRNHSIQYFAYPDYKFQRLRKESPEKYESYTDLIPNKWITMRIDIQNNEAKLYINDNEQPSLIVNDLKLGSNIKGSIGMFVDVGTEGFFKDLKVIQN